MIDNRGWAIPPLDDMCVHVPMSLSKPGESPDRLDPPSLEEGIVLVVIIGGPTDGPDGWVSVETQESLEPTGGRIASSSMR